jgi:hypothetical protein
MLKAQKKRLVAIETDLRSTFLDFNTRASGNYNKHEVNKGAAYLVLSHAAVEEFFESIAGGIVSRSETKFKSSGKINRVIAFVMFSHGGEKNLPDQLPNKDIHSSLVITAIGNYKKSLDKNNGIKEYNLCRLFLPLGYTFEKVDPLLLPELDALGSARGDLAHKSIKNKQFDPFAGKEQVNRIFALLGTFENSIAGFISAHA